MHRLTTATHQVVAGVVSPGCQIPRRSESTWRAASKADRPPASIGLRAARERVVQTAWFEIIGLAIVTPLSSRIAGTPMHECLGVLALLSLVIMIWSAAFNTLFDLLEFRVTGRQASDRPHRLRVVHAIAHEAAATVISCPVIYAMTELSWMQSLQADVALAITYAVYGYLFHWLFDRLRPLPAPGLCKKLL